MKKSEKERPPLGTMSYLSKAEAAEYLRISSRSLTGNIELGWLPAHSLPSGEIIFRRDELDIIVSLNPFIPLEKNVFFFDYRNKAEYFAYLGWVLYNKVANTPQETQRAKECIKKAISMNEWSAPAHYFQGMILKIEGDIEGASREFDMVLDINPDHAEAKWEKWLIHGKTERKGIFQKLKSFLKETSNRVLQYLEDLWL